MAKTVNIDAPNPALPEDIQAQIAMQNARETKQILMKQGVTLLVYQQDSTIRSTASTAYVQQESLRQAFATNGGFVDIDFKTVAYVSVLALFAQLVIDGQQVDETLFDAGIGASGCIYLKYRGALNAGNHVLNIAIKVNGGTGYMGRSISGTAVPTTLWVTETIL